MERLLNGLSTEQGRGILLPSKYATPEAQSRINNGTIMERLLNGVSTEQGRLFR